MTTFLIWSFEHDAWWGPGERGYPTDIRKAGHYSLERAVEICTKANLTGLNEAVVPLPPNSMLPRAK
jgi:hypothetical protein